MNVVSVCLIFIFVGSASCKRRSNTLLQNGDCDLDACDTCDACDAPPTNIYGDCVDTRDGSEDCQDLACSDGCQVVMNDCEQSCQPVIQLKCIMTGDILASTGGEFAVLFIKAFSDFLETDEDRITIDLTEQFAETYNVTFELVPGPGETVGELFLELFDNFGFGDIFDQDNAILANVLQIECLDKCDVFLSPMDEIALGRLRAAVRSRYLEKKIHTARMQVLEDEVGKKKMLLERDDIMLTSVDTLIDTLESAFTAFIYHIDTDIDRFHRGFHDSTYEFADGMQSEFEALFPFLADEPEFSFNNYGETVQRNPKKTFTPTNQDEVIDAVNEAIENNKRIRCGAGGVDGEAHSWNDIFCDDNHYHINMRNLNDVDDIVKHNPIDDPRPGHSGEMVVTVTMPPQLTNLQLLTWFLDNDASIPLDVILTWVTIGGTVTTSSHGAGWDTQNLSDLVYKLTVINSEGKEQEIDYDTIQLGAGNSLGLWGPITTLTLFVDSPGWKVAVKNEFYPMEEVWPRTGSDFSTLQSICADNFYNEIFLFPFGEESFLTPFDGPTCHVMTFNRVLDNAAVDEDHIPDYTGIAEKIILTSWNKYWEFMNENLEDSRDAHVFYSGTSYLGLPSNDVQDTPYVIPIPNAMHYATYLHETKASNVEFAFPITTDEDGIADFSAVRDAWYFAFDEVYDLAEEGKFPVDGPFEIRFTGTSNVVLSPAHHSGSHTGWLELLSGRENKLFYDFISEVIAPKWWEFEPNAKPHWGKWSPGQIDTPEGLDARQKIMDIYADDIATFKEAREASGVDPDNMFLNKYLSQLFDIEIEPDIEESAANIIFGSYITYLLTFLISVEFC